MENNVQLQATWKQSSIRLGRMRIDNNKRVKVSLYHHHQHHLWHLFIYYLYIIRLSVLCANKQTNKMQNIFSFCP